MQHQTIAQLEDALAHLEEGRNIMDTLVWLRARQIERRIRHVPRARWIREQVALLIADVDRAREELLLAQANVVAARGSRKKALD